jgi:chemotaxis protein methyltransferase CheR
VVLRGLPSAPRSYAGKAPEVDALALPRLEDDDFDFLRALVAAHTGINLSEGKRAFVAGRLARRLRELRLSTYAEYCRHLRAEGEVERTALFDALCTHETRFFREPDHFEFLVESLLPSLRQSVSKRRRPAHLSVWSAGCSTGEEAYSLAMVLARATARAPGLTVDILATDLSTRAIETARHAVYPLARADEIPKDLLEAYMLRGRGRWEGWMRAGPEIRARLRFEQGSLHRPPYQGAARFDAIFCRNVLIYFDASTRARVVGALLGALAHDGALFLGRAEGLQAVARARTLAASVFARIDEATTRTADDDLPEPDGAS